jgi:hypothetical protein
MDRYRYRDELEFIHYTISTLPTKVQEIIKGTHFVTSYCPKFLGIIGHDEDNTDDGRKLSENCFAFNYNQRPLVFMTRAHVFDRKVLLHELGHIVRFESEDDAPEWIDPLNCYAAKNYHECYATAFQSFLTSEPLDEWYYHNWEELFKHDVYTYRYFEKQFGVSPHKV